MSVDLLDGDQVAHRCDHPADLGTVILDDGLAGLVKAKRAQRLALVALAPDPGLDLGDLEAGHQDAASVFGRAAAADAAVASALARSIAGGATSSIGRPRRAAISSGRCSD